MIDAFIVGAHDKAGVSGANPTEEKQIATLREGILHKAYTGASR